MSLPETIHVPEAIEAVVAVFDNAADANRVAAALQLPDVQIQNVSRKSDFDDAQEMPSIVFEDIGSHTATSLLEGVIKGGAIGAGSGLLLLGIPGLNIAAPIAGAIAGAWIGGVAGVDEANRMYELPNQEDYRRMLAEGKSFVVIPGDEQQRIEYANRLKEFGVIEVHQHPPVGHLIQSKTNQSDNTGT